MRDGKRRRRRGVRQKGPFQMAFLLSSQPASRERGWEPNRSTVHISTRQQATHTHTQRKPLFFFSLVHVYAAAAASYIFLSISFSQSVCCCCSIFRNRELLFRAGRHHLRHGTHRQLWPVEKHKNNKKKKKIMCGCSTSSSDGPCPTIEQQMGISFSFQLFEKQVFFFFSRSLKSWNHEIYTHSKDDFIYNV